LNIRLSQSPRFNTYTNTPTHMDSRGVEDGLGTKQNKHQTMKTWKIVKT